MSRERVGKCPVCGRRVGIYLTNSIVSHVGGRMHYVTPRRMVIESHLQDASFQNPACCPGTGVEPAHDPALERERARRAKKQRTTHDRLIAPFREHAAVALDALIDCRRYPLPEMRILLRVAVHEYNVQHPPPHPNGAAVAIVRYVAAKNNHGGTLRVGDLYCLFCGELRLVHIKADTHHRVDTGRLRKFGLGDHHAMTCALKHLAFGLVGAKPGTRKLPEEFVQAVGLGDVVG